MERRARGGGATMNLERAYGTVDTLWNFAYWLHREKAPEPVGTLNAMLTGKNDYKPQTGFPISASACKIATAIVRVLAVRRRSAGWARRRGASPPA